MPPWPNSGFRSGHGRTRSPAVARLGWCDRTHSQLRRGAHIGRKKWADIVALIESLLEYDTAGDPFTGLKRSRRTTHGITAALADFGAVVSPNTLARLIHKMAYLLRVDRKMLSTDQSPDRNQQFLYRSDLRSGTFG